MFTISDVTQPGIDALAKNLRAHATTVQPTTPSTTPGKYQIAGHGVLAVAQFDAGAGTLAVTITRKPFFVTEGMIEVGLRDALKPAAAG